MERVKYDESVKVISAFLKFFFDLRLCVRLVTGATFREVWGVPEWLQSAILVIDSMSACLLAEQSQCRMKGELPNSLHLTFLSTLQHWLEFSKSIAKQMKSEYLANDVSLSFLQKWWRGKLGTPKKNNICHDCVFKVSLWEKKMHIFSILNVCVTFVGNIFFAPIDFFFLVKLMKNDEFPLFLPPKNHVLYLAKVHFCFHHSSPISRL